MRGRAAVAGRDRAAISLHDLAADREAEAGVLAEMLGRSFGVEAPEDRFEIVLGNARPLVVDRDHERSIARLARQLDHELGAPRTERQRVVDHVADDLAIAAVVAVRGEGWIGR